MCFSFVGEMRMRNGSYAIFRIRFCLPRWAHPAPITCAFTWFSPPFLVCLVELHERYGGGHEQAMNKMS
jgi:hypothetical protein